MIFWEVCIRKAYDSERYPDGRGFVGSIDGAYVTLTPWARRYDPQARRHVPWVGWRDIWRPLRDRLKAVVIKGLTYCVVAKTTAARPNGNHPTVRHHTHTHTPSHLGAGHRFRLPLPTPYFLQKYRTYCDLVGASRMWYVAKLAVIESWKGIICNFWAYCCNQLQYY